VSNRIERIPDQASLRNQKQKADADASYKSREQSHSLQVAVVVNDCKALKSNLKKIVTMSSVISFLFRSV